MIHFEVAFHIMGIITIGMEVNWEYDAMFGFEVSGISTISVGLSGCCNISPGTRYVGEKGAYPQNPASDYP